MAGVGSEVISGGGWSAPRWPSAEKARIVRESLEPGAVAWKVAEQPGSNRWQLYDWRRKARGAAGQTRPSRTKPAGRESAAVDVLPAFAPVVTSTPAIPLHPPASEASLMEIAISGVTVRVRGVVTWNGLSRC